MHYPQVPWALTRSENFSRLQGASTTPQTHLGGFERDHERPLDAPWVRLADGRVHARWAFLPAAAADQFCYNHGAWWVERRTSKGVQARDRVRPLPLYVDPAVLAAARGGDPGAIRCPGGMQMARVILFRQAQLARRPVVITLFGWRWRVT